jgi:hypothetical protein
MRVLRIVYTIEYARQELELLHLLLSGGTVGLDEQLGLTDDQKWDRDEMIRGIAKTLCLPEV